MLVVVVQGSGVGYGTSDFSVDVSVAIIGYNIGYHINREGTAEDIPRSSTFLALYSGLTPAVSEFSVRRGTSQVP